MRLGLAVVAVLVLAGLARGADVLKGLREGHPRLMVLDKDVERVRGLIETDGVAKGYFERVKAVGEGLLREPVSERVIIGPRLLHISRQVLMRVATLGGMYRLTGEKKYADRCRDEMLAAARFVDWNSSHFLDTAEMSCGLGLGYDWIYDVLTPEERKEIKAAIVEKGLKPGVKVYDSASGWHKRTNNWNQVCNGGLAVGALAIADEEPELARKVLEAGRASMPVAMKEFAPDGGFVEGPGYWNYATIYTVFYLSALETALGTDFEFLKTAGFPETGEFRMQSIGATMRTFNFADAGDGVGAAAQMFWMARALQKPVYAAHERMVVGKLGIGAVGPFHLMWYNPAGTDQELANAEKGAWYKRIDVVFMRTGWGSEDAFVGFKAGSNAVSHSHLDLGSFVYDAGGVRWAVDLGPDDYNLPGYFGKQRWDYYRLRTEGQNAVTIDGENQDPKGTGKITLFSAEHGFAGADLTNGYPDMKRVGRGVKLMENGSLLVQDEIEAGREVEVVWHMHTAAKIRIEEGGKRAVLEQGGKKLMAQIMSPAEGARFEVAESDRPPGVESTVPTGRVRKVGEKLVVKVKGADIRLGVLLTPGQGGG